ncbi:DUF1674-domain-containing protein [Aureobasidium subglaciale]|nr:DUF1674-domain-containing protein [Aureobasidium subglaciale]KAI5272609.1 DUF1674-domain-containing protein [Aureobasidium subglaciale]
MEQILESNILETTLSTLKPPNHNIFNMSSLNLARFAVRSCYTPAARRAISTSPAFRSSWSPGPSPPRLPKEEQEVFDKLMKQSTGAFSTPQQAPEETVAEASPSKPQVNQSPQINQSPALKADGKGEELHPNVRRGAPPEFEGDVNPQTGEVGGPKNNPLRWGHGSDWSYNGRVTDF